MLSLTTSDIEGATPTKPFSRFTNKPPKDDIEGSRPKSQLKSWDRPVLNLTADDITGCHPVAVPIREHTRRSVNPLNPTYQLPSFTIQSTVLHRPARRFLHACKSSAQSQPYQCLVFEHKAAGILPSVGIRLGVQLSDELADE
eukprot:3499485-Rhodomonas_salina.2